MPEGAGGTEPRTWTLNVCPECNSAVVAGSAWVPPEFVANCRHVVRADLDQGRNVKRESVRVVEQQPPTEGKPCLIHKWMGRVAGSKSPCPHCFPPESLPPGPPEPTQGNEWDRATVDAVVEDPGTQLAEEEERTVYWNRRWFKACKQLEEARHVGDGLADALEEARRCEWAYPVEAEREAIIANAEEWITKAHALGWGAARDTGGRDDEH